MAQGALKILPVSWDECTNLGWKEYDILLVTGDAYIDHPSFGIAIIARLLEREGYRVAILSQPRFDSPADFLKFPAPQLFCGITGGNLDSIVANYSGNGKVRDTDAYSPHGNPYRSQEKSKLNRRRPDRATIIYGNLARVAFKNTPIVLGGIEASLRRFIHYDYKQKKLRGSVLSDAKANLLIYGMAEKSILETAHSFKHQRNPTNLAGSCIRLSDKEFDQRFGSASDTNEEDIQVLPSWQEIATDKSLFLEAEKTIDDAARQYKNIILAQKQQASWVIQFPAPPPLNQKEMDDIYTLPFSRKPHPSHENIPAYTMIKDSVTIVRGCSGNCSFCAITRHQGPLITSRSIQSIVDEVEKMSRKADFSGTISDLGGPTANLFGTGCAISNCKKHDCLFPKVCPNLTFNERLFLQLLQQVSDIKGVKHVFISSGLRMELLRKTPKLFDAIINKHTPGILKIAPEHTEEKVLQLMHKEKHQELVLFLKEARRVYRGKHTLEISPYIISAHPGCNEDHTRKMVARLKKLGLHIRGFQDFTPTPGTLSTAMFYTGLNSKTSQSLTVPTEPARKRQRTIIENGFFKKNRTKKKSFKTGRRKKR